MFKALFKAFMILCFSMAAFIWLGYAITRLSGSKRRTTPLTGINVFAGEEIFWSKGRCYTCHSVGERGSAIRGPNLGIKGIKFPTPIGLRALERAKKRSKMTGKYYTSIDYLIESVAEPAAYVVEGYKKEMPKVYTPPISLTSDEVKAVITYLLSQRDDEVEKSEINEIVFPKSQTGKELMSDIESASLSIENVDIFKPYMEGNPKEGEQLFFDIKSDTSCGKCHTIRGKGGKVGPDLSDISVTRTIKYIIDSILDPGKEIANGYDPILVVTLDGLYIPGIKKNETDTHIVVAQPNGEYIKIAKNDIEIIAPQKKSIMPDNFKEFMTLKQFHDILAFLKKREK